MVQQNEPTDVRCPICTGPCRPGEQDRCPRCQADLTHPAFARTAELDARLQGFQAEYDALAVRWREASAQRENAYAHLNQTRIAPHTYAESMAAAGQTSAAAGPAWAGAARRDDAPEASAAPADVRPAAAGAPTRAVPHGGAPAAPRRSAWRESLTAPVLLGLSGAVLLIASAVVFVAVTWQTFFPPAQALLLLALAGGTGWLAHWLTRKGLGVSAGAVGVVAMAFAGTSVVALARALTVLGPFTASAAAAAGAAAGWLLARRRVAWVPVVATGALGVAAVGLAVAGADSLGIVGWTLLGSAAAAALAALAPWWIEGAPRRALLFAAWALVPVIAGGAVALGWSGSALLWAWLPVGLGAFLTSAGREPRAGAVSTVAVASGVAAATAHAWGVLGAAPLLVAVVAVAALALAGRLVALRAHLVAGLFPAAVAAALAAPAALGAGLTAALDEGGSLSPWVPVGLVALACSTLLTRSWSEESGPRWASARVLSRGGAVLLAATLPALALVAAPADGAVLALSAFGSALVGGLAALAWVDASDRRVLGIAAVVIGVLAGLGGAAAWSSPDSHLVIAGLAVLLPLAASLGLVRRFPRALSAVGTGLALVTVGATVARLTEEWAWAAAAVTLAGAVAVWILARLAPRAQTWAAPGLAPAALTLIVAFGLAFAELALTMPLDSTREVVVARGPVLATLLAGGVAAAAFRIRRPADGHPLTPGAGAAIEIGGVVLLLAALVQATRLLEESGATSLAVGLASLVGAVLLAATAAWWSVRVARTSAFVAASAWSAVLAARALVGLSEDTLPWWQGALLVALVVALLAVGARWRPHATLPVAFALGPLLPPALVGQATGDWIDAGVAAAFSAAAACWLLLVIPRKLARVAGWGVLAPALAALPAAVSALGDWIVGVADPWLSGAEASLSMQPVLFASAGALAAVATQRGRRQLGTILTVLLLASASSVPATAAWIVLTLVAAAAASALVLSVAPRLSIRGWHAVALIAGASLWAGPHLWAQVGVLVVAAGVLLALAWHDAATRQITAHASAIACGAAGMVACHAAGLAPVSAAAALGLYGAALAALLRARWVAPGNALIGLLLASFVLPLYAASDADLRSAGVAALVAAAAWLAVMPDEGLQARWLAGVLASVGLGLVVFSAGFYAVEAYTVLPAAWALAEGVAWMRRDPQVPSLTALSGGLAIALVPSIIALAVLPGALTRTLVLTFAVALLAFATVLLRWLAPAVAAAATAIAVALAQFAVDEQLAPRWVSFAVVGAVLIALAATYERLKELR
ncbi:SCO7613 C-terminal domain-containing membrane protein [Demequina zhanjiangensis]|uniref:DUF2157 domain-containing protein n=1 Tax=Demequina zhanjiangensis TaxID=3051659 RepID=A0ABT8G1C5_9MICO|nr:hypothetical protein [Demequina sp. SYSU T00b26]MDN4472936.1 hypothetical protein [Demequina sp. SYSU T00b26]